MNDLQIAGGVEWCAAHHGVRNEDAERCDMYDDFDCPGNWEDEDDHPDDCAECACDLRPLYFGPAVAP